jgi:hypothetical protein
MDDYERAGSVGRKKVIKSFRMDSGYLKRANKMLSRLKYRASFAQIEDLDLLFRKARSIQESMS